MTLFCTISSVFYADKSKIAQISHDTAVIAASLFGCLGFLAPSGSVQGAMAHSFEFTSPKTYYLVGIPSIAYLCVTYVVLFLPVCMWLF